MTDTDNPTGVYTEEVSLYNEDGAPINTANPLPMEIAGPLDSPSQAVRVSVQDQYSDIVDLYMHKDLNSFTLASDASIGDYTVTLTAGHSFVVGNVLCLKEGTRFYQGRVLVVATNVITLDSPIDYAFTASGATGQRSEHDMAVNGSVTRQEFHITPPTDTVWDVVRVIFHIEDDTAMDDGLFGGIAALTKGCVLLYRNGHAKNIFNVKTNGEFAERTYDREYVAKPPAGTGHAMNIRRTFGGQEKNGVVIRLDGATGDELVMIIQDDLTGLSHFHGVVQGHVVV